jgi:hypothetical protein
MALPLPRVVADVGPGGPLVTAMGGINSLHNDMILRKINEIKAQYAPVTAQAEAASKLAYANLMGPQFLAKIMGNDSALANLSEDQKNNALNMIYKAGTGGGSGNAMINNVASSSNDDMPSYSGIGQPSTNSLSGWITNKLKNAFSQSPNNSEQNNVNAMNAAPSSYDNSSNPNVSYEGPGIITSGNPFVGRKGYKPPNQNEQNQDETQKMIENSLLDWSDNPENPERTIRTNQPTYEENIGKFKGTVKQGEEAGKYRAQALNDIGKSQLALSNSGAALHRMADIIKDPVVENMRSRIPFFQDKQLSYLEKMGTKEEQKKIGNLIATSEQIIASGVQAFGGKPLVREFDLLQRQKVNRDDTIPVAEGKVNASIALHDIAEKKNEIISDLLQQGMNESDAVKQANKMVDVSAIERETDRLLQSKITEEDIKHMMDKYKISRSELEKRLKAAGHM